jgi:hypothetical protein
MIFLEQDKKPPDKKPPNNEIIILHLFYIDGDIKIYLKELIQKQIL